MKVKICGITRLEDALAAAEAGADLLGFNFYAASTRYIEIQQCQEIVSALRGSYPAVKLVGVFVNTGPVAIERILSACGLDFAQLTGDEMFVQSSAAVLGHRAYPALRISSSVPGSAALTPLPPDSREDSVEIPAFLVDAHLPGFYGGTGKLADWELAASLAAQYPILLAGGLTPDNVQAGIRQVKPWGVDVASGVESSPRIKDHQKVRQFIKNAKTALNSEVKN